MFHFLLYRALLLVLQELQDALHERVGGEVGRAARERHLPGQTRLKHHFWAGGEEREFLGPPLKTLFL
jgi:hypothetical protein